MNTHTFISDASGKPFPLSQKVSASNIRAGILELIQKEHPGFSTEMYLSVTELNSYRQKYIDNFLNRELSQISELEQKVVNNLKEDSTITEKLEDIDISTYTFGQRLADKVATFGGSWRFIIAFGVFILIWILINVLFLMSKAFDPYPFILLNLILSCIASLQAPVIMMSQNRQEEKDRDRARKDYMINLKSELEIRMLHEKIDHLMLHQQQELLEIQQMQTEMLNDIMEKIKDK